MEKELTIQDDIVEKQSQEEDYYMEGTVMADSSLVYEDEFIRIFDGEYCVIISIISKGISIQLDHDEWNEMRRLALGETNDNSFDSEKHILVYGFDDEVFDIYFRGNNLSVKFSYREYELLKKSVLKAGSPHPWTT